MSLALRVAAFVLFALGLLVASGLMVVDGGDWQPLWTFAFGGLAAWVASDLVG